MQSVLSFIVMQHLSYTNPVTRSYNSGFIKLIFIFPSYYLRSYKKRIFSFF